MPTRTSFAASVPRDAILRLRLESQVLGIVSRFLSFTPMVVAGGGVVVVGGGFVMRGGVVVLVSPGI